MSSKTRLIEAIVSFLGDECKSGKLDADIMESLEVSKQCLEQAYSINPNEIKRLPAPLTEIFIAGLEKFKTDDIQPASKESKENAERFKNEGNELMKVEKYEEALNCYSRAIECDARNAVYYCNRLLQHAAIVAEVLFLRAAAFGKLGQHKNALEDCSTAIEIDPSYSKAYGRKGLAHTALSQFSEAVTCYERALDLDPSNQSYLSNLQLAKDKSRTTGAPNMGGLNLGGMDFGALLNNPALMNMATQMMGNPQMRDFMSSFMTGGGAESPAGPADPSQASPDMSSLLSAGQQLAQQMQESNPELVEQLRSQYRQQDPPQPDKENNS